MAEYIAIIHKDEGSDYSLFFADFPGCMTAGSTMEEARAMAADALAGHVEILLENDVEIPAPTPLDAVVRSEDAEGALAFFVVPVATRKPKVERKNITALDTEWERIDKAAQAAGKNRSAFMIEASVARARELGR
jgi:predicted RNase H-like HicB family nuclease